MAKTTGGKRPKPEGRPKKRSEGKHLPTKRKKQKGTAGKALAAGNAPVAEANESDDYLSDEDIRFVAENAGRLGFLSSTTGAELDRLGSGARTEGVARSGAATSKGGARADQGDAEEEYELVPRGRLAVKEKERRAETLPTKTPDGRLVYNTDQALPKGRSKLAAVPGVLIEEDAEDDEDGETKVGGQAKPTSRAGAPAAASGGDAGDDGDGDGEPVDPEGEWGSPMVSSDDDASFSDDGDGEESGEMSDDDVAERDKGRRQRATTAKAPLSPLQEIKRQEEQREEAKQRMAVAATRILAQPDAHLRDLRALVTLTTNPDMQISRLAMLSLLAIFRDVIPGYRIRPPTEKEAATQLSKEVKKLREFESGLLSAYQIYLKNVLSAANCMKGGQGSLAHARVAVRCLAGLLTALPHFNYTSDLLQALVARMAHRDEQIAAMCCVGVHALLAGEDKSGGATAREAVQLVADLVKQRKCQCRPRVVEALLDIQLSSADVAQPAAPAKKESWKAKRKRKGKKGDDVDAAFDAASAVGDVEERRRMMSQTLEAMFEIFFRVLKQCTASGLLQAGKTGPPMSSARSDKKFPLLLPALRGLSLYGHLVSVDYFADILAVMQRLSAAPALSLRARLALLATAADILKGKGQALNLDRRGLHVGLYLALLQAPLIPLLERAQRNESALEGKRPCAAVAVAKRPLPVLLADVAHRLLVQEGRDLDAARALALAKRLLEAALLSDTATACGLLAVLERLIRRNRAVRGMLDPEAGGPAPPLGLPQDAADLDAGAAAARCDSLWELPLLAAHPSAPVARAGTALSSITPEGTWANPIFTAPDGPAGVAAVHSPAASPAASEAALPDDAQLAELDSAIRKCLLAGRDARDMPSCQQQFAQQAKRIRIRIRALLKPNTVG